MGRLFLLFTLGPMVELYLLLQVGQWLGPGPTLLLIVTTGVVGAYFARREGARVWKRVNEQLDRGEMPTDAMLDGVLVFVGGVLMVTPGVLSDLTGIALVVPPTRAAARMVVKRWAKNHVRFASFLGGSRVDPRSVVDARTGKNSVQGRAVGRQPHRADPNVIDAAGEEVTDDSP